jgi:hypothetical protein
MDYTGLPFAKGRPASLLREDRRKARQSKDEKESEKVKQRSGGRCEAFIYSHPDVRVDLTASWRCHRRAVHVHHILGGNGTRGRGPSALAVNKLHVCVKCHSDIHAHVLVPDGKAWRRIK